MHLFIDWIYSSLLRRSIARILFRNPTKTGNSVDREKDVRGLSRVLHQKIADPRLSSLGDSLFFAIMRLLFSSTKNSLPSGIRNSVWTHLHCGKQRRPNFYFYRPYILKLMYTPNSWERHSISDPQWRKVKGQHAKIKVVNLQLDLYRQNNV